MLDPASRIRAGLRVTLYEAIRAGISGNLRVKVHDYPRVFTTLAVKSEKSPPHWYGGAVKHADVLKAHLPVEPKAHLSGRAQMLPLRSRNVAPGKPGATWRGQGA